MMQERDSSNAQKGNAIINKSPEQPVYRSHDFRRPVTNIIGLMSVFRADGYTTTQEGLYMLEKAVQDLEAQISALEKRN
jgi:hypothetical protein